MYFHCIHYSIYNNIKLQYWNFLSYNYLHVVPQSYREIGLGGFGLWDISVLAILDCFLIGVLNIQKFL